MEMFAVGGNPELFDEIVTPEVEQELRAEQARLAIECGFTEKEARKRYEIWPETKVERGEKNKRELDELQSETRRLADGPHPDLEDLDLDQSPDRRDVAAGGAVMTCVICGRPYEGHGHNARPVAEGRCCDACNASVVVPHRIAAGGNIDDGMAAKMKAQIRAVGAVWRALKTPTAENVEASLKAQREATPSVAAEALREALTAEQAERYREVVSQYWKEKAMEMSAVGGNPEMFEEIITPEVEKELLAEQARLAIECGFTEEEAGKKYEIWPETKLLPSQNQPGQAVANRHECVGEGVVPMGHCDEAECEDLLSGITPEAEQRLQAATARRVMKEHGFSEEVVRRLYGLWPETKLD
jgi:hypothetical protein